MKALQVSVFCFFLGCAKPPEDTFPQKAREHCVDVDSCNELLHESIGKRKSCREREDCDRIASTATWLKDRITVHRAERQAREDAARDREINEARDKEEREREQARLDEKRKQAAEELADWSSSRAEECKKADVSTACEDLEKYALKYKDGSPHLQEAKSILQESSPKLAALRDEAFWSGADLETCKAPKRSSDCNKVLEYLEKFPTGKHAPEATKLAENQFKKLEAMADKEREKYTQALDRCQAMLAAAKARGQEVDISRDYEGKVRVRWCGTPISEGRNNMFLVRWRNKSKLRRAVALGLLSRPDRVLHHVAVGQRDGEFGGERQGEEVEVGQGGRERDLWQREDQVPAGRLDERHQAPT